jgi:hypothetical protein
MYIKMEGSKAWIDSPCVCQVLRTVPAGSVIIVSALFAEPILLSRTRPDLMTSNPWSYDSLKFIRC